MSYKLKDLDIEVLDLDKSPDTRWVDLVKKYENEIRDAYDILYDRIYQLVGAYGQCCFDKLVSAIVNGYGSRNHYYDELMSISKALDVPFHKVVVSQYGYEMFAACSSAVYKTAKFMGKECETKTYHLRTMDWNDNSLRPLTIQLKIMKDGKLVGDTTTWVGFIGFFTIVKPGLCSLSINYRRNKPIEPHRNLWGILMGRKPISYLVRDAILNNDNYDDIVKLLKFTPLSAPCYITLAHVDFKESMILVRDRCDCHTFLPNTYNTYLFQSNNDPWDHKESTNRNESIKRRQVFDYVHKKLISLPPIHSKDEILSTFLQEPILKFNNIYCNVMVPSDLEEPNYTKYMLPGKDLRLMIDGTVLKFWNQIPPDHFEKDEDDKKND